MNLEEKFLEIIEKKHEELNLGKDYSQIFSKVRDFEANAIGQIGEEYIKLITSQITEIEDDGVIHNEYDVLTKSGIYFEVKTARKGRTNNTFQFNGINPRYNYDYLICLGICEDKLLYRIFLKSEIQYIHKERNHYIIQGDYKRQLVQMNPDNLVNLKLTINITDLYDIASLIDRLKEIIA
ncbi:MAG: restriction endonuclease [Cytophagales bacterium]|nr:MAG: restriction endonuclease [Cytophagales bacterium]